MIITLQLFSGIHLVGFLGMVTSPEGPVNTELLFIFFKIFY